MFSDTDVIYYITIFSCEGHQTIALAGKESDREGEFLIAIDNGQGGCTVNGVIVVRRIQVVAGNTYCHDDNATADDFYYFSCFHGLLF